MGAVVEIVERVVDVERRGLAAACVGVGADCGMGDRCDGVAAEELRAFVAEGLS